jgi:hypothetical protein
MKAKKLMSFYMNFFTTKYGNFLRKTFRVTKFSDEFWASVKYDNKKDVSSIKLVTSSLSFVVCRFLKSLCGKFDFHFPNNFPSNSLISYLKRHEILIIINKMLCHLSLSSHLIPWSVKHHQHEFHPDSHTPDPISVSI